MSKKTENVKERRPKLRCFVSGWGMSRDGKITVVERHEVPMKGARSDEPTGEERKAG